MPAIAKYALTALDCAYPRAVAEFYSAITGWPIERDDGEWIQLRNDTGGPTLAFQLAPDHRPPEWPSSGRPQQLHIDFDVADLDAGEEAVLALGARKAEVQPTPDEWRVYLDPAGHPFCLVREG
jgi:predicted enzyme related to lactoylglutathione lyase